MAHDLVGAAARPCPQPDGRRPKPTGQHYVQDLEQLQQYVQYSSLTQQPFDDLQRMLRALTTDRFHRRYPRLQDLRQGLLDGGCAALLEDFLREPPEDDQEAEDRLSQAFAMTVIRHIEQADKRLFGIDAGVRDRAAAEFVKADLEGRDANAQRVRRAAADHLVDALDSEPGEAEVLRDQLRRKRGFKPVRQLMSEAPNVLLAAKPVWAASPQTVSELLRRRGCSMSSCSTRPARVLPAAALPGHRPRGRRRSWPGIACSSTDNAVHPHRRCPVRRGRRRGDEEDETAPVSSSGTSRASSKPLRSSSARSAPGIELALPSRRRAADRHQQHMGVPARRAQMTTFPAADGLRALQHVVAPHPAGLGTNNKSPQAEVADRGGPRSWNHAQTSPTDSLGVIAFGIEHAQRLERELERRLAEADGDTRLVRARRG